MSPEESQFYPVDDWPPLSLNAKKFGDFTLRPLLVYMRIIDHDTMSVRSVASALSVASLPVPLVAKKLVRK